MKTWPTAMTVTVPMMKMFPFLDMALLESGHITSKYFYQEKWKTTFSESHWIIDKVTMFSFTSSQQFLMQVGLTCKKVHGGHTTYRPTFVQGMRNSLMAGVFGNYGL